MLMRSRRNQLEGGQEQHCKAQTPVTLGPHGDEGEWAVSLETPCPRLGGCEKLLMDEMLGFCCGLASLGHAADQPHLWLMGSRCSALQGGSIQKQRTEDSDALSLLFPLKHQSRRENYT